jgi:AraC-like DNA-binding protein
MKLNIKKMVSNRCKIIVKSELEKLGINFIRVDLGGVELMESVSDEQIDLLNAGLVRSGLALLNDRKSILIEKIKIVIIEIVHYSDEQLKINFSDYLSEKLNYNYTYLANLFSENQGITIEHYFLKHRIERVKELLIYDDLNITEIAYKVHFSSVGHLSNQFKKLTGLTPTQYKHLKNKWREPLENL